MQFVAVNGLFVAVNLVAAGVMLLAGLAVPLVVPDYRESVLLWYLVGLLGIAAAMLFARVVISLLLARSRARARA